EDRPDQLPADDHAGRQPLRHQGGRAEVPGPARTDAEPLLRELSPLKRARSNGRGQAATQPALRASATAASWECTSSLVRIALICERTVASDTYSRRAMSSADMPSISRAST